MIELKTAIEKSQKSLELLLETYNNIWTVKQFPKSWNQATIIPTPKPGKILHTLKTIVP